jgi:hypothetical protein
VADGWLGFKIFVKLPNWILLLGGPWDAGSGLEILSNTIALTKLNLSPIGFT